MAKDDKGASPEAPPVVDPEIHPATDPAPPAEHGWQLQKNFGYIHNRRHYHFPKGELFDVKKDKMTIEMLIRAGAHLVEV